MLATFSAQQGRRNESPPLFLLRCFFEPIFFRKGGWYPIARCDGVPGSGVHFGRFWGLSWGVLAPSWLEFGGCLPPCWHHSKSDGVPHFGSIFEPNLVPTWRHLGPLWCKSWFWMGWWGYAKRKELEYIPGDPAQSSQGLRDQYMGSMHGRLKMFLTEFFALRVTPPARPVPEEAVKKEQL